MRRVTDRLTVLGTAVLLGTLLAGCGGQDQVGLATADATVGTCKDKTTAEEMVSLSDVSPAVPCTTPHTLETYHVTTADASVAALRPDRPGPEILGAHSTDTCPAAPLLSYLGATLLDSQWGVSIFTKFPTRAEWSRGTRTVLCDLVVSTADAAQVPRISIPLRNIMRYSDSARLRQCRTGDDDTHVLTCDRPHTAERAGDVVVGAPAAEQQAQCDAQARTYVGGQLPAGASTSVTLSWTAECWIVDAASTTSRGTLRGGLVQR
jgi:hypothetical protein